MYINQRQQTHQRQSYNSWTLINTGVHGHIHLCAGYNQFHESKLSFPRWASGNRISFPRQLKTRMVNSRLPIRNNPNNRMYKSYRVKLSFYVLKFSEEHKHVFAFHVIVPYWQDTGSWNLSSSKTRTHLFYIVNIMGADVLATQGGITGITRCPHIRG